MPPAELAVEPSAAGPLADSELTAFFAPLAGAKRIALGVSGGGDSLALLDCVDRWHRAPGRPGVVVLTVDHRLQPGSGEAAELVRAVADARGLSCRILVRQGDAPSSAIEASARNARYRLLIEACRIEGATHLVVAHHRDDVAETFVLRLKRGAGVFGLAAMRPVLDADGVTLVRPFLQVPRARLAATTAAAGLTAIQDPMNSDPRFGRTTARRFLSNSGLDADTIATLAMRFAELADAIDARATAFIAESVVADAFAIAWLDAGAFASAPPTLQERILVRLLIAVGGADYPPRSDRLAALMAAMIEAKRGRFKRTLAGAVIERRGGRFALYREAGRTLNPPMAVRPGETVVFDHRYVVTVAGSIAAGLTIGSLGVAEGIAIGTRSGKRGLPAGALAALPTLRENGKILAIPGLLDGPATFRCLLAQRLARPPLFPDFPTATIRSPSGKPTGIAVIPS